MNTLAKTTLSAAALSLLLVAPAQASTLPVLDLKPGQLAVAGGVGLPVDLSLDYALNDRLSVGASYIPMMPGPSSFPVIPGAPMVSALRATYRLGETPEGLTYGVTVSGGTTANVWGSIPTNVPPTQSIWLQPALNLGYKLGAITLRGTVGPLLFSSAGFMPVVSPFLVWPNLELAWQVVPNQELTVGGNSLIGWRARF